MPDFLPLRVGNVIFGGAGTGCAGNSTSELESSEHRKQICETHAYATSSADTGFLLHFWPFAGGMFNDTQEVGKSKGGRESTTRATVF